jgi:hypothetical protein
MPRAIHANGQLSFEFGSLLHVSQQGQAAGLGALQTWFLLYHAEPDCFRVELSLPEAFEGGRITRWTERILLPAVPRHPTVDTGPGFLRRVDAPATAAVLVRPPALIDHSVRG